MPFVRLLKKVGLLFYGLLSAKKRVLHWVSLVDIIFLLQTCVKLVVYLAV